MQDYILDVHSKITQDTHSSRLEITANESSVQKSHIFFAIKFWSLLSSSGHFESSLLIHLQSQGPFDSKGEGSIMVLNVQIIHPTKEHHITEDLRFQHHSDSLKSWISILISCGYVSTPIFTSNFTLSANPLEYPNIFLKQQKWETCYEQQLRKSQFIFCTFLFCIYIHFIWFTYSTKNLFQLLKLFIISVRCCPILTCPFYRDVGIDTRHEKHEQCIINCNFPQTKLKSVSLQHSHFQVLMQCHAVSLG